MMRGFLLKATSTPAPAPAPVEDKPWDAKWDGIFSLSTLPDDTDRCKDTETLDIANVPLIDLLCGKYKNITTLFMHLIDERKMTFAVQETLLNTDYFDNPDMETGYSEMKKVGSWAICACGYIEQVLIAVQRTLHYHKHIEKLPDMYDPPAFCDCWSDGRQVNVLVLTKFNGKRVQFRAVESGPEKYFCLYLKD